MSRIEALKNQSPNFNFSIFDFIKILDPSEKNTYSEFLFKFFKKKLEKISGNNKQELQSFFIERGCSEEKINSLSFYELFTARMFFDNYLSTSDLQTLNKFEELRKIGLIKSADLTLMKDFESLNNLISITELKSFEKELEKQIIKLYEDEEWLCLRPLTFQSSLKYGANTKWCTTHHDSEHFFRYASSGILIYTINKKTGNKVATFYSLKSYDPEFSFWNQIDNRIDSLLSTLPDKILKRIVEEINNCKSTNLDLTPLEFKLTNTNKTKSLEAYDDLLVRATDRVPYNEPALVVPPTRPVDRVVEETITINLDWNTLNNDEISNVSVTRYDEPEFEYNVERHLPNY